MAVRRWRRRQRSTKCGGSVAAVAVAGVVAAAAAAQRQSGGGSGSLAAAQQGRRHVSLDFCGFGSCGGGGGGGGMAVVVTVAVAGVVCLACFGQLDSFGSLRLGRVELRPRSQPRSKMGEGNGHRLTLRARSPG